MTMRGPHGGRIVRPMGGDDLEDDEPPRDVTRPDVTPFIAAGSRGEVLTAKESLMPKGQYDRSKAKPRGSAAAAPTSILAGGTTAPPAKEKGGRKRKGTAVAARAARAAAPVPILPGRFDVAVDLRGGGVTITASEGSLKLTRGELLAIFAFLTGRPS